MSETTIAYFDARARVEPIRVILEELAIPYEDQRISFENWIEMKSATPFGALPSYRSGDPEIQPSRVTWLIWTPSLDMLTPLSRSPGSLRRATAGR